MEKAPASDGMRRVSVDTREGYNAWAATYDATPNFVVAMDSGVFVPLVTAAVADAVAEAAAAAAVQAAAASTSGKVPQAISVLDAGCGTGRVTAAIVDAAVEAMEATGAGSGDDGGIHVDVVGIDFAPGMLAVARERLGSRDGHGRVCWQLGEGDLNVSAETSSWAPEGGCAVVVCALVGEHITDLAATVAALAGATAPGGRLLLSAYHPYMAYRGAEANFRTVDTASGEEIEFRLGAALHGVADYVNAVLDAGLILDCLTEIPFAVSGLDLAAYPAAAKYAPAPSLLIAVATTTMAASAAGAPHRRGGKRLAAAPQAMAPIPLLTLVFLTAMGMTATTVCYVANAAIAYIQQARAAVSGGLPAALSLVAYVGISVAAGLVAAALVKYIAPAAAGSGIPEMKSHLAGVVHAGFLSGRTLGTKFVGLVAAQAAGLSIGKEGPFVHLAAATAAVLFTIPLFAPLYAAGPLRIQLLAAAVAVGVTATFGAPIGAVLFSVEVTATYYFVDNLPKAYYAAVVGLFFVRALAEIPIIDVYKNLALFSTDITQLPYSFPEFVAYAGLGLAAGLMGAGLFLLSRGSSICGPAFLRSAQITWFLNRLLHEDEKTNIERLVSHEEIESLNHILFDLGIYVPIKFVLTTAAVVLPIPSGVFSPVFAYGAAFGRFVGEIMSHLFPTLNVAAGGYAIVGAAAMTAGVTRTISTAIIAVELTGQTHHLVPSFLAVLIAYSVGNLLTLPFYEVLLSIKNIPFLPKVKPEQYYAPASSLMRTELITLTLNSTYGDVLDALHGHDYMGLPWVDSTDNDVFLGVVARASLEDELYAFATSLRSAGHSAADLGPIARHPPTRGLVQPAADCSLGDSYDDDDDDDDSSGTALPTLAADRRMRASTTASVELASGGWGGMWTPAPVVGADAVAGEDDVAYLSVVDDGGDPEAGLLASPPLRRRAASVSTLGSGWTRSLADVEGPIPLSAPRTAALDALVNRSVRDILDATPFPFAAPEVVVDDAPFTLAPSTTLQRVDFLFKMAGVSHMWICFRGRLQGVITKKDFIFFTTKRE
ncbi:chloride channel protein 2 [Thecamonas trahens ATCC 50062]|uniref:Chloride channel protein n=1 Tax=Thecamonas trahens ATCC 50062 TaxID=461836 RepID=A0A0L0DP83_THETB|nr:chloride channel protein 2 [Thecamonas trahens ATCC 50062]KNC53851.1 chloride channel protein 2 [Thecamonas trahens ATCC 50062]|eukprot:XP_013754231.1 chloride channel protein 2 [Thecamonas trahens ATCC 50062]